MKKNSFRFKRNRKAIAALLICVGFVGIHPLAVFAEDDVNVVQCNNRNRPLLVL